MAQDRTPSDEPQVVVEDLVVALDAGGRHVVDSVSFQLHAGEVLGVVGESGSGKTTAAMSLLGYTRSGATIVGGSIRVAGRDVRGLSPEELRMLRGRTVAYVPQDPRASLNPAIRIGQQIEEVLETSGRPEFRDRDNRRILVETALDDVGLPSDRGFLRRFPHQLSGGQLQRVGIAMAIVAKPPVVILDEPTTGLDVTTQAKVLSLVRRLCSEHGIAGLYVTHDLAVIADIADRVMVMQSAVVVESGEVEQVLSRPQHEYTVRLLAAAPDIANGTTWRQETVGDAPDDEPEHQVRPAVLDVRDVELRYRSTVVGRDLSFDVRPGECVALVGGSGSGKTTLSRALIGLHRGYRGRIAWGDDVLAARARRRTRRQVRDLQYIFQSPWSSLNPRSTIKQSLEFAFRTVRKGNGRERDRAIREALARAGLRESVLSLMPNQLSGGERQRVSIARALVVDPKLLICDEVTSALDVIVQRTVVESLLALQAEKGLSMLFVTHNLALVKQIADRVIVMKQGEIVEAGPTAQIMASPEHPYTRELLENTPSIASALEHRRDDRLTDADR